MSKIRLQNNNITWNPPAWYVYIFTKTDGILYSRDSAWVDTDLTAQGWWGWAVASVAGKTWVVLLVKADVGLGNVNNTSDLLKPLSTASINALAWKSPTTHTHTWFEASLWNPTVDWQIISSTILWVRSWINPPTWLGWWAVASVAWRTWIVVLTKSDVWLANVNNTTDLLKPLSTATIWALALKEDSLWNPTVDWQVMSSTILWVRSWITPTAWGWWWATTLSWLTDAQNDIVDENLFVWWAWFTGTYYNKQSLGIWTFALDHPNIDNSNPNFWSGNIAVWYNSLTNNTTGYFNSANGSWSMQFNTTGHFNVGMGYQSLHKNTTWYNNIWIGYQALLNNTTWSSNTLSWMLCWYANTTGSFTTGMWLQALYSNQSWNYNVALWLQSMFANISWSYNTATWMTSLYGNTSWGSCSWYWYATMYSNTSWTNNTAIWMRALFSNATGHYNTTIWSYSCYLNSNTTSTVSIGYQSWYSSAWGGHVFIWHKAGYNETWSNKLHISNTITATPLVHWDFTNKNVWFSTTDYAWWVWVQAIANATTVPALSPVGWWVFYSSWWALYWKWSAWTITMVAPA